MRRYGALTRAPGKAAWYGMRHAVSVERRLSRKWMRAWRAGLLGVVVAVSAVLGEYVA